MNSIIKNFKDWSVLEATAASTSPVFFASAKTSASNIQPDLAAGLGVKPDTLYTVTFPGKDLATALISAASREGSKFGKSLAIDAGSPVKPGTDILEIGGQSLEETGTAVVSKAQAAGITSVKASNNGLLALMRLGKALAIVQNRLKISPSTSANWAVGLTLGGQVEAAGSRETSIWYAKLPTEDGEIGLTDIGNTVSRVIALTALAGSKTAAGKSAEVFINQADPKTRDLYEKYVKGQADPIASVIDLAVKTMAGREILPNSAPSSQAANDLLKQFIAAQSANLVMPKREDQTVKLTSAGEAAFAKICDAAVNSVLPTAAPTDFPGVPADLISSYAGLVKLMFGARFNKPENFDWVQTAHQYTTSAPTVGSKGSVKSQKAEGEI